VRKQKISPYIFLCLSLFCVLSFSDSFTQKVRFFTVSSFSPSWRLCESVKKGTLLLTSFQGSDPFTKEPFIREMEELKRENRSLCEQMENVRQWVLSEDRIEEQMNRIKSLDPLEKEGAWRHYFHRRKEELSGILKLRMKAIPAKVIYRDPASWSSFVWIGVGERQNRSLKEAVIAKNSPVVIGNVLVGLVEEVGEKQSKVRLLTDANLFPSVRSIRGGKQDQFFIEQMEGLLQLLGARPDLFSSREEESQIVTSLQKVVKRLDGSQGTSYLAKGELKGSSLPLWRTRGQSLKGLGFNYDFADSEGPARDLRTGESLLKEGDLLVTTGLDGVFPAGLEVAVVSKVHSLKEGASSYELEAKAIAENFNELSSVFVLPPLFAL
jgi:cell shape-determining protein MreC